MTVEAVRQLIVAWLRSREIPDTPITEISLIETSQLPISGSVPA
tara:strand:+ start:357 stop:488 length:132 start_codon:yes stop_codon:yes gene_type:complete